MTRPYVTAQDIHGMDTRRQAPYHKPIPPSRTVSSTWSKEEPRHLFLETLPNKHDKIPHLWTVYRSEPDHLSRWNCQGAFHSQNWWEHLRLQFSIVSRCLRGRLLDVWPLHHRLICRVWKIHWLTEWLRDWLSDWLTKRRSNRQTYVVGQTATMFLPDSTVVLIFAVKMMDHFPNVSLNNNGASMHRLRVR